MRDTFVELYEGDRDPLALFYDSSRKLADIPPPPGRGSLDVAKVREAECFFC